MKRAIIGGLADQWGLQTAVLALCPIILIGAFTIASGGAFFAGDIARIKTIAAQKRDAKK